MKSFQYILIATTLLLSTSSVMAATESKQSGMEGFHALSQVTNAEKYSMAVFSDEQLDDVVGGYNEIFSAAKITGLRIWNPCWVDACGGPKLSEWITKKLKPKPKPWWVPEPCGPTAKCVNPVYAPINPGGISSGPIVHFVTETGNPPVVSGVNMLRRVNPRR